MKHKFKPMLGPYNEQVEGSAEWAECIGNQLDYEAERMTNVIEHMQAFVDKVETMQPWLTWRPAQGDKDKFYQLCTGYSYAKIQMIFEGAGLLT